MAGRIENPSYERENGPSNLGQAAQLTFAAAEPGIEKSGIKAWDFGDLPATLAFTRGGRKLTGYPALADDGDSVSIRLFDTRDAAPSGVWDIGSQSFATTFVDANNNGSQDANEPTTYLQQYLFWQSKQVEATQIATRSGDDVFHADPEFNRHKDGVADDQTFEQIYKLQDDDCSPANFDFSELNNCNSDWSGGRVSAATSVSLRFIAESIRGTYASCGRSNHRISGESRDARRAGDSSSASWMSERWTIHARDRRASLPSVPPSSSRTTRAWPGPRSYQP